MLWWKTKSKCSRTNILCTARSLLEENIEGSYTCIYCVNKFFNTTSLITSVTIGNSQGKCLVASSNQSVNISTMDSDSSNIEQQDIKKNSFYICVALFDSIYSLQKHILKFTPDKCNKESEVGDDDCTWDFLMKDLKRKCTMSLIQ